MWWLIPVLPVLLLLVHLAKMARLYLVLMEHKINFKRFLLLYCKTTLVNLVIPYKIGELYRVFKIGRETRHWQVGILSVIIDRFFDVLALFLLLASVDVVFKQRISAITGIFFVALAIVTVIYMVISPTYTYLNKYLIVHKQSGRSMLALKGLEFVRAWYDFSTDLIRGRFALITISSLAGWVFEVLLLKCLSLLWHAWEGMTFGIRDFSDYVTSIFFGGGSLLMRAYTWGTAGIFFAAVILLQILYWIGKKHSASQRTGRHA
ncbi:MAG: flippase-like domain-containing protein [Lachnospiraceae bacterium]|nr:flippase-like domain-containing protein [Lachnospiraceae bacterium]